MSLIECKNAEIQYEGKAVIRDLSFSVNKGDYLCIVGENGSGKTTLINGILNLVKLKSGYIKFDNELSLKNIGYMPQQTDIQKNFPASVYEVVMSGNVKSLIFLPFYKKGAKENANNIIKMLGISDIKNKCYHELSGGQQQRVLLARAICSNPSILILDEPVTALDPVFTKSFYQIINMLNKKYNITIIMVTHDILGSIDYATHILHLDESDVFFGTKDEYINNDASKRILGGEKND